MDQGERIYVPDKDICMQACSSSTTLVLDEEILFKVIAHPLPNLTLCGGGGGGGDMLQTIKLSQTDRQPQRQSDSSILRLLNFVWSGIKKTHIQYL